MIITNENQNDIRWITNNPHSENTSQSELEKLNHNSHYNIACDKNNKKKFQDSHREKKNQERLWGRKEKLTKSSEEQA
jgi:hypothetical protein